MASAIFARSTRAKGWNRAGLTEARERRCRPVTKPNDRLSSFERLEIYNRVYWFRVLDCLYDDYPGLRAIVGERRFLKLATAYLAKYPSASLPFAISDSGWSDFCARNHNGSRLTKSWRSTWPGSNGRR